MAELPMGDDATVEACPGEAELAAFARGALPPQAVERVAAHVTWCAGCQARLASLDDESDDLVLAIRQGTGAAVGVRASGAAPLDGHGTGPLAGADVAGPDGRIGNYRVRQLIGEGGFGTVYLAEQTHPFQRQVALKLIKPGMDTRQVLARFQAEREALAMMDHPNIARVLDAGTTDRGRPYFVMELARGAPITAYCDDYRLSARGRLELFASVCDAVQHAHTKGVIHRDIKPTNVLVTFRDDVPVPKVIDFGVAKAVGGRTGDGTLYTHVGHFIGTPEYMSPEQADGGMDVDARTDVYSLGVLLYELLTGTTPLDAKDLRSKGLADIGRTIRESDPPRPSTRVGGLGETRATVAERRGTDVRRLTQSLRGELDWIVMRCLERDRTRRYETANALATDVRRFLRDEPVRAGPPGAAYQLRKFVRRHRAGVGAAASIAAAVVLGLVVALFGLVRATADRNRAERAIDERDAAARSRRLAQADAVATAAPASAIALLEALRESPAGGGGGAAPRPVLDLFSQRLASAAPGSVARYRAACALALLGEPRADELISACATAPASEGPLVIAALAAAASGDANVIPALNARAAGASDVKLRARHAIALLFLGDDREAGRVLGPFWDSTRCAALVAEFGRWHGDLTRLPAVLRRLPEDQQAGLCLAAGRVDPQSIGAAERDAVVAALRALYADTPDGGVHSAAGHALRQWGAEIPAVVAQARPAAGRGWFVNAAGLTMVRAPAGLNVIGNEPDDAASTPVLFTRPLFVADRETPVELFEKFADDPAVPEADRPRGWQSVRWRARAGGAKVVVTVSLADAARFCNWLSAREGRRPCYDVAADDPALWRCDAAADGYRLPTSAEWEYAARAGAGTDFVCGDGTEYLEDFATLAISGSRAAASQPNRWGLFDTAGGVWELCWDVDLSAQPAPPGPAYPVPLWTTPVVDPWPADGGRFAVCRGGADESGTSELRIARTGRLPLNPLGRDRAPTVGFRVVCAAPAGDAPANPLPAGATAMWERAADCRPEVARRIGTVLGRRRRFAEAAAMYERMVRAGVRDLNAPYYLAVLRSHLGDAAGYRAARDALTSLAADYSEDVLAALDRAAKAVLLDPAIGPGPALDAAAAQAAEAVRRGGDSEHLGWFVLIDGMAEYRAARFGPAIERLARARDLQVSPGGRATAEFFLAMAQYRAGQTAGGRATFDAATAAFRAIAPPDADDWGDAWPDLLVGALAQREAAGLLGVPAPVPASK